MADVRITDLVAPEAITQLKDVQKEIENVKKVFLEVMKETATSIKVKIETVGDIEKLNNVVTAGMQKAEAATVQLNTAVQQQREIVGQTSNAISRELAEIEKENKVKREAFMQDKNMLEVAKTFIGTREQNLAKQLKEQATMKDLTAQKKLLNAEYSAGTIKEEEYVRELIRIEDEYRKAKESTGELNRILKNQYKELNAVEGSYQQLSLQLEQLKMAYKKMTDEEKASPMGQAMNEEILKMDAHLKDLAADMGEFQRNVGNYAIAAGGFVDTMLNAVGINGKFASSLKSLADSGAGNVIEGLTTKTKAFFATLSGFLANPVILTILGIGGTIAAFKWWYDYNKGIMEATRLTREFLGVTGEELEEVRSEIQAIADVYDKDYKEVLEAVDILTKQFGIDTREALDVVRGGFQAGADLSGNMLNNMKQYAPIFKDMKLDGSQLAAVLAQTRSGIFNEQGLQMMQMATKKLGEMSSGTKKALKDLGISTDEWNEKLLKGEANFFDYLQEVSKKIGELPRESQEVSNAFKEVFGRNGASGGMEIVKYIGEMTTSLEEVKKVTGEVGKLNDLQVEKQKELNDEVAKVFDTTQQGFEEATISAKIFLTDMLIEIVKYIGRAVEWFKEFYNESLALRAVVQIVGAQFKTLFNFIALGFKQTMMTLNSFAKLMRSTFDFSTLLSDPETYMKRIGEVFEKAGKTWLENNKKFAKDTKDAWVDAVENAKNHRLQLSSGKTESTKDKEDRLYENTDPKVKADGTDTKALKEKAAKAEEEVRKIVAEAAKKTIEERLKIVEDGSEEEMKLREQLAEAEKNLSIANAREEYSKQKQALDDSLKQKKISQEEYAEGVRILEEKLTASELAAEHDREETVKDAREKFASAEIERISEQYSVRKSLRDTAYVQEVADIERQYAEGLITKEQYEQALFNIKNKYEHEAALAVVESLEKQLEVEVLTDKAREEAMRELAKAKADLAKQVADAEVAEMERTKKADADLAKKRMQNTRMWLQMASQAVGKISGLMSTMYDNQAQRIEDEKEANQKKYDEEIERITALAEHGVITTEEAEARKTAAEQRRAEKEAGLEKKKQDLEYKKAVWEKVTSVAQAGIATALAITQALPNIALAALVGAMGAIQVATILATPIKAYARGTGEKGHDGGLAMVGDGGKHEVVVVGNSAWLTPDKPVVVDLPKGAMVYPDVDEWKMEVPLMRGVSDMRQSEPKMVVVNDYKRLEKKMDERNRLARMEMRLMMEQAYRDEFVRYRRGS